MTVQAQYEKAVDAYVAKYGDVPTTSGFATLADALEAVTRSIRNNTPLNPPEDIDV